MLRAVPGIGVGRRVGPTDQHGEIAEVAEAAHRDAAAGQSWTDFMPASRSRHTVSADGQRLQQGGLAAAPRAEDGKRGLLLAAASRSSAVMMRTGTLGLLIDVKRMMGEAAGRDRAPKGCLPVLADRAAQPPVLGGLVSGDRQPESLLARLHGARRDESGADVVGPGAVFALGHLDRDVDVLAGIVACRRGCARPLRLSTSGPSRPSSAGRPRPSRRRVRTERCRCPCPLRAAVRPQGPRSEAQWRRRAWSFICLAASRASAASSCNKARCSASSSATSAIGIERMEASVGRLERFAISRSPSTAGMRSSHSLAGAWPGDREVEELVGRETALHEMDEATLRELHRHVAGLRHRARFRRQEWLPWRPAVDSEETTVIDQRLARFGVRGPGAERDFIQPGLEGRRHSHACPVRRRHARRERPRSLRCPAAGSGRGRRSSDAAGPFSYAASAPACWGSVPSAVPTVCC